MVLRIQALSPDLANQIAAGEVIERPASVVKELLENARDAQASMIHIELDYAGLNRISVVDNGVGIHCDDLPLAIAAHATSKIKTLDDLYAIDTMGFRGEALASIASVSKLIIQTKTVEDTQGNQLSSVQTKWQITPVARQCGTTVTVSDLFYNAPVRKRFLKSERSEFLAVDAIVRRFAMSAPEVGIKVSHNGKPVLDLPAASDDKRLRVRLQKLFGKPFMQAASYIDETRTDLRLTGWLSDGRYQRSHADKQWVYVNQRMVKDKLLNHAIKQAYESVLYPGRYPACLLYLTLNPAEVDVNVHPTKHELRFQQPRLVHDFIYSVISKQLENAPTTIEQDEPRVTVYAPPKSSRWQIAEAKSSFVEGTSPQRASESERTIAITPLHEPFVLITYNQAYFLADKRAIAGHALRWQIEQHPLPLPSRPVLVPIRQTLDDSQMSALMPIIPLLSELGIEVTMTEQALQWRSVPVLLPQLSLQLFLERVSEQRPDDRESLTSMMVQMEIDQISQLNSAHQAMIADYLQAHQRPSSVKSITGLTRLDADKCQSVIYG